MSLHVRLCVCDQIRVPAKNGGLSVLLSKVGGLTRWNCWKSGGDFFQGKQGAGGGQFLKKTLTKIGNI